VNHELKKLQVEKLRAEIAEMSEKSEKPERSVKTYATVVQRQHRRKLSEQEGDFDPVLIADSIERHLRKNSIHVASITIEFVREVSKGDKTKTLIDEARRPLGGRRITLRDEDL